MHLWPKNLLSLLLVRGVVLLVLLAPTASFAQSLTIQGKIVSAAGNPVNGPATEFRVQILAPNATRCVLFDETHVVDLSTTGGLFTLSLNDGLGSPNAPATYGLEQAISNGSSFTVNASYCDPSAGPGPVVYSPNPTDNRKVVIQFRDPASMGSSWETIPEMDLNPVAYSMESRTVGGYGAASVLRVANSGIPGTAAALTSAQFSELQNLIGGTSSNYMSTTAGSTTGARLPTVSGNPATPSAGSIWFDTSGSGAIKYYDSSGTIQTLGTGSGVGTITSVTAGTGMSGGGSSGAVTLNLANTAVTPGSYGGASAVPVLTVDAQGRITAASTTAVTGTLPSGTSGEFLKSSGSAWSSSQIKIGDIKNTAGSGALFTSTGCSSAQALYWDSGTDEIKCQAIGGLNTSALTAGTIADARLADVGTAGTYRSVTVDGKGRVTAGTNPTTLAGYGITDALVNNAGGVPTLRADVYANLGSAGTAGRLFVSTDTLTLYRDNGSTWDIIGAAGAGSSLSGVTAGSGLSGGGTSGNVTISMPAVGTAGTYFKVTTDAQGRVSSGAGTLLAADIPNLDWAKIATGKPTTLSGYGITDPLVGNGGGALSLAAGNTAGRGPASTAGRIYIDTQANTVSYDTGSSWQTISSGGSFTGSLAGDVTGTQGATVVANVGGSTAANVNAATVLANAATSANTASTIVKRDASGNFSAGAVSQGSAVFRDATTNTIGLAAPSSVTSYNLTLPAAAPGSNGQVLSATTAGVLSWVTPTAATSVTVNAPLSNSGTGTAPNISIPAASGSVDGYLSSANFTAFTNKLSSVLNSAMIFVGNGSNVATGVTPSGDVSMTNAGAFTVNAIKGKTVTAAPTTAGQVLRYDGTNLVPNFVSMGDLRSTVTGASALTTGCTAGQTLTWNSGTDNLQCQSISIAAASQITGVLPIANGGTGAISASQGFVFAGPASGGAGAPSFRALAASDLPASASFWSAATGGINYAGGNVGIATTTPSRALSIGSAMRLSSANSTVTEADIAFNASGLIAAEADLFLNFDSLNTGTGALLVKKGSETASATTLFTVNNAGNVGIGTASPSSALDIRTGAVRFADSSAVGYGLLQNDGGVHLAAENSTNGNLFFSATTSASFRPTYGGTANAIIATAAGGTTYLNGTGGYVGIGSTGASYALDVLKTSAATPDAIAMRLKQTSTSGVSTDSNALLQFSHSNGSNSRNWNIGTGSNTLFGHPDNFGIVDTNTTSIPFIIQRGTGNVGVGVTIPTAAIHLKAGTATAGTAPLKFASGTALTTPENGAVEYDGTDLFLTSGGVRRKLASTAGSNDFTGVGSITGSGALSVSAGGTNQNLTLAATGTGQVQSASVVSVTNTTASTSSTTGALKVSGGLGVAGDIFAGATVNAATSMMAPQIYGSTAASGTLKLDGTSHATKGSLLLNSAGGSVGINTTAPGTPLHIAGANASNTPTGALTMSRYWASATDTRASAVFHYWDSASSRDMMVFGVSGSASSSNQPAQLSQAKMIIREDGNVGVGTTVPITKLDVSGSVALSSGLNNTAARPVVATSTLANGEIRGYSANGITADDGFLRLAAGGGTTATSKSWLDISGFSTVSDMDKTITAGTNGIERLRITSAGNVGIGTSGPWSILHLKSPAGTNNLLTMSRTALTDQNMLQFAPVGAASTTNPFWFVGSAPSSGDFYFNAYNGTSSPAILTLQGTGNVGIGTTDPTMGDTGITSSWGMLGVAGPAAATSIAGLNLASQKNTVAAGDRVGVIHFISKNNTASALNNYMGYIDVNTEGTGGANGFGANMRFITKPDNSGYTEKMRITAAGNVGIGTTAPLYRFEVASGDWDGMHLSHPSTGARGGIRWTDVNATYNNRRWLMLTNDTLNTQGTGNDGGIMFRTNDTNSGGSVMPRMVIAQDGKVGIGITSPVYSLDVFRSNVANSIAVRSESISVDAWNGFNGIHAAGARGTFPSFTTQTSRGTLASPSAMQAGDLLHRIQAYGHNGSSYSNPVTVIDSVAAENYTSSSQATYLSFGTTATGATGANERMRITSGGNVGIGSPAPAYKLDVAGDINSSGCLRSNAGVVSGAGVSDSRLKEDVKPFTLGLSALLGITPKTFRYNGLGGQPKSAAPELGVIAQEVEKTAPALVSERLVTLHEGDREKTAVKQVNYSGLLYTVINSVKELYGKLLQTDAKVEALQAENAKLKAEAEASARKLASIEAKLEAQAAEMNARLKALESAKSKAK